MDPSTTPDKVAVPKVIPMNTSFKQKMEIAKKRGDDQKRKKAIADKLKWNSARGL